MAIKSKRAALYVRVSTDRQTLENQLAALRKVIEARGWQEVAIYKDQGISGAKGRADRPGLDQLLKDASRRKFDVILAWSIDRIGRSLIDLLSSIQHLEACGVDLYLDQQSLDTTTPAGKLLFHVTGSFAEYERSLITQRIHAGLARAKKQGKTLGRPLGATSIDPAKVTAAKKMLRAGNGILKTAKAVGLGNGTVEKIKAGLG